MAIISVMTVLTAFVSQYIINGGIMFVTIQKEASLFDIVGHSQEVTCLHINKLAFGDANGNARLEISSDRTFLKIYTEDDFVSVAKIPIEDIDSIEFGKVNINGYTGESFEMKKNWW